MKTFLTAAAIVPLLVGGVAFAAPAPKVTICHATSSETSPYVRIVVSGNATAGHFEENGTTKAGHEEDILLQGEVECPTPPKTPPNTPPVTPPAPSVPPAAPPAPAPTTPTPPKNTPATPQATPVTPSVPDTTEVVEPVTGK